MGRGLFSFLLVVAFIPSVLYAADLHMQASGWIIQERTRLIEHQVLTNKENEFEHTFWATAINSARNGKDFEQDLKTWKKIMENQNIRVWSGEIGPDYYNQSMPVTFENLVELSPNGNSIEIKKGTNPYSAIGASIQTSNAYTLFLIPVGCSRGL